MKHPTPAQRRPVSLEDIYPVTIVRPRSFENGLRLVWFYFVQVPILLMPMPPHASKRVDPDLIPQVLRNHPSIRRALIVKVVLEKRQNGSYYVSPVRATTVVSSTSPEASVTKSPLPGQTSSATTMPTNDRFEKEIMIVNVLPGVDRGIELNNSLTFKWQTIGQCENCLICRSNHRTVLNHETYQMSPAMRTLVRRVVELEQNDHVLMYPLIVGGAPPIESESSAP